MTQKQYLNEILNRSCLPASLRRRAKVDLAAELAELTDRFGDEQQAMQEMGPADEIAAGLYETYASEAQPVRPFVEYRSQRELFGLPLVHIVKARRVQQGFVQVKGVGGSNLQPVPTARGVLAIGRRAVGVIAIGNLTCGVVSIGNLSVGVLTIANMGLGLLGIGNLLVAAFSIANAALGLLAAGNMALGLFAAAGNLAVGPVALGNVVSGQLVHVVNSMADLHQLGDFFAVMPKALRPFFELVILAVNQLPLLGVCFGALLLAGLIAGVLIARRLEPTGQTTAE
ncbi:MAG: hypothetical protein PHG73_09545 [Pygmaiobacter sp.]|nr:hypothetical protein [Pygmaiobacter sp.]